jgi:RNA recognition motif-containing protein
MIKLFVVEFQRDMKEVELLEMFSPYGAVKSVKIITDKDSGVSMGYGFIAMEDEAGATRAIASMNGASIDDREISVRIADYKRTVTVDDKPVGKTNDFNRAKRPRRTPK